MSGIKFKPVQGNSEKVKNTPYEEGYVYFTTDTGKIYLDANDKRITMGGNSGVFYGSMTFLEEELENFIFSFRDIEGDQVPNQDDLILNIPDGCFYRVESVDEKMEEIKTIKLTIAGSGAGPGTNSSIPVINDPLRGESQYFVINQKEMNISFYCNSQITEGNKIETIEYYIGTDKIYTDNKGYNFGETISFDIVPYLKQLNSGTSNTLRVKVFDSYGNESKQRSFSFYLVNLELTSQFDLIYKMINSNKINYSCYVSGGATLDRFLNIDIVSADNQDDVKWNVQQEITRAGNVNLEINLPEDFYHGRYVLKASLRAILPNEQEVSSLESIHQIIYYKSGNAPIITGYVSSNEISQYDTISIKYLIVDENSTTTDTKVLLYVDNKALEANAKIGEINNWTETFKEPGLFTIGIEYKTYKQTITKIQVLEYNKGDLPMVDKTNLILNLSAEGRSNIETNKASWGYGDIEGKFKDFLWGETNGWLKDPNGQTALKLTNNASFWIDNYRPFEKNATDNGLTIELDFMFSGVLDYSKPLIKCLSFDEESNTIYTGFNITGQKATLNSNFNKATSMTINGEEDENGNINETDIALQAFTQYYNEDERIHLTYVIEQIPSYEMIQENDFYFVYTYLNGVLSGIMKMKADKIGRQKEEFKDTNRCPAYLEFNSEYGDIYIYNIRVYGAPLDSRAVINNYIADLTDINKKVELYRNNDIFDDNGNISLASIKNISEQFSVPYVLFNGGSKMPKKLSDKITYSNSLEYALPLTKSDYRLMSMKMFDKDKVVFEVPLELEDSNGIKITDFKDIKTKTPYTMNRGVQVYGQGTSSMVYPVKNLRLKFKQEQDYPVIYDGAYPVEIACFKADYMDSSASHNTGTANLIYDLLTTMNLRTPAQQFKLDHHGKEGVATHDLLTAIRGFPIICFYAEGNSDTYTYIGRYNFNIDKATPEPFGFFPQKFYTGEVVIDDNGRERKEVKCVGLKTEVVKEKTVLPLDAEGKEIERDIIQCWEFLNNDTGSPTKFLTSRDALKKVITSKGIAWSETKNYFTDFEPGYLFKETLKLANTENQKYGWMDYYEDRYPDAIVSGGAFALENKEEKYYEHLDEDLENGLFRLACWINSTAVPLEGDDPKLNEVTYRSIEPVYYQTRDTSYNLNKKYYSNKNGNFEEEIIETSSGVIFETGVIGSSDSSNLTNIKIEKDIFAEKVNNVFGNYTFVYSAEFNKWSFETEEPIYDTLEEFGVTYEKTPDDATFIIVSYYLETTWENTLYEKYTIDNEDYRLAKFKAEFTDYIDLNFALFYYVLTMILLMMDSRAKNMMLATWDQKVWYPIFYDMDSMLGLNNTGFNKFAYDTEDDPKDKVFNGFDSVLWNNFRTCFYSNICKFYADLTSVGELTLAKLLRTYNADASDKWNEALTTADAEYKYIRPYEKGYYDGKNLDKVTGKPIFVTPGKTSYLYAGQGKRTNQRSYWLSNRLNYFDSKYKPHTIGVDSGVTVDNFNFRAYALPEQQSNTNTDACIAQVPANHKFTLKALNNSYQSIYIGNILYGPTYAVANEEVELGPSQVKHEVESYIFNPTLISDLGDLSDKYLGTFNFPSAKTRLSSLRFGRSIRSHKVGEYEHYYNKLLNELNISDTCPYLQEINVARCIALRDLNLTQCPRLTVVDAEKTGITSISFPANSVLEELYLPNSLTSLTLIEQPNLKLIQFDDLSTEIKINKVHLDNINTVNTYPIIKNIFTNNQEDKTYLLKNINWVLTDLNDVILNNSNAIKSIDILEKLYKAQTEDNIGHARSLSGNIHIAVPGVNVNVIDVYNKYWEWFPNVTFTYDDEVMNVIPARTITFLDANGDIAWSRKIANEEFITKEFLSGGPNGALTDPTKGDTESHTYSFSGTWKDDSNGIKDIDDICDIKVIKDWVFTPIFNESIRSFEIAWIYNIVGNQELQNIKEYYDYGSKINIPTIIPYKDDSLLELTKTYSFKGWAIEGTTTIINSSYKIKKAVNFIPIFEEKDVKNNVLSEEYLIGYETPYTDSEGITHNGYQLKANKEYSLQGKITLPKAFKGKPVIGIYKEGFSEMNLITHIFWEENSNVKYLGEHSFYNMQKLKHFEITDSLEKIDSFAFLHCRNLKPISIEGKSLKYIGDNAFNTIISDQENQSFFIKIGGSIKELGQRAFAYNSNGYKEIQIGGPNEPSQLQEIGDDAFAITQPFGKQYNLITIYTDDVNKEIWDSQPFAVAITITKRQA